MARFIEFADPPVGQKGTSGWLKNLERGVKKLKKKLIPTDALNTFWSAGRAGLDGLAAASGIPLTALRQQYRTAGINPDDVDSRLVGQVDVMTQNRKVEDLTATDWQFALDTAENSSFMNGSMLAVIGVILAAVFVFGTKKGRSRAGGFYRRVRSFRMPRFRRRGRR